MNQITWRLLITDTTSGPMNMAIDHAILEAVSAGNVRPTIRFYSWRPACLSLGYMQPSSDVDPAQLTARGWDLVRRLTGGRAILHIDELTYSVAVKDTNPIVAGSIVASYRHLSAALLHGLHSLGLNADAEQQKTTSRRTKGPVCFEVPNHYELTINSKKLIGSAQVRKFGAVLQHGSLPLAGDITRICDALTLEDDTARDIMRERVRRRATTLTSALGRPITWHQAAQAMIAGFQQTFNLDFNRAEALTRAEQTRAEELYTSQYTSEDWNARF